MKAKDLKNSILQLAVQGKLVEQDPNDEPASVLIERIREARAKLIKEKKIKAPKGGESVIYRASDGSHYEKRIDAKGRESEPVCIDEEIPFEVPESWEWVRLDSLCSKIGSGSTPEGGRVVYTETGPMILRSQNVHNDGLHLENVARFAQSTFESRSSHVAAGDLLLNITGASIGRCSIVPDPFEDADVNQHVLILRLLNRSIDEFVHLAIVSSIVQDAIMSAQVGATKEGLSATKASALLIPIPPLAEQRRIVERVERLMPLVEEYGRLEDEREELDTSLTDRLRKSVLHMAVQGKLIAQDPLDEPASELLERIREERHQLIAEKKLKVPKGGESIIYRASDGGYYEKRIDAKGRESEPVCIDEEIPFEIPDSWEWCRLGSLVTNRLQIKPSDTFCYIDIASIDNLNQCLSSEEQILTAEKAPSRARKPVEIGDVLYSTVRPYLHNACIIDKEFSYQPIASTGFAALVHPNGYSERFLLNYLISPIFDEYANSSENSKGVAYPAINDDRLYKALIPIPPFAEQRRIVEQVNCLINLI